MSRPICCLNFTFPSTLSHYLNAKEAQTYLMCA